MHFIPKHSLSQPLNGQEEEEEEDSVQELEAIGEVLSESGKFSCFFLLVT